MNKKELSERDICTKFITPAVTQVGWDLLSQIREEVGFTKGRIIVRGKLVTRGKPKRADYVLYFEPNIPIALIEANADYSLAKKGILLQNPTKGGQDGNGSSDGSRRPTTQVDVDAPPYSCMCAKPPRKKTVATLKGASRD